MKYVYWVILALLALMSLAAGGAKLAMMQQEVTFFAEAGLDAKWLYPLGTVQVIGALLAIYPRSRALGAVVMALGFFVSSVVILMTGNIGFALISLIPVILSGFVARYASRAST
ncbi:hypothetical protein HFP51_09610 [Parasphingopyxis sp. CP4]|nr:hypothetical protein HFP51_09610 [Parasphingopyxis sp. CP4]